MQNNKNLNYISLFSSAGVGCYGFKLENFNCIATNEIIERRLQIQKNNNKCKYESGYISGDIRDKNVVKNIFMEIEYWKENDNIKDIDVLMATPPCQGISVANHKKKNEKRRNSLIVESIKLTKDIKPKFFIFENVRSFLNATCTDLDSKDKKISKAIEFNLGGNYNILSKVINFKEYGNNSSRTRTIVIGTRKDLMDITPYDIFPKRKEGRTLKELIGHLPSLATMGQISDNDIYHNFKKYSSHMLDWIKDIKEGQTAFENDDPKKRPHKVVNGEIICNQNKNGDKYTRCFWNKIGPCVHTRNDILSSQATIHPTDNRVFSIRELMLLMTIPKNFKWIDNDLENLNKLSTEEKIRLLSKEEINIRQSIGEAVPTEIFRQIAERIKNKLNNNFDKRKIKKLIQEENLFSIDNLINFVKRNKNKYSLPEILKIAELSNEQRENMAGYYTRQDVCFSIIKNLPKSKKFKTINILEPSVGSGNFIPLLINKYSDVPKVNIDVVDIDSNILKILKEVLNNIYLPKNININFIHADFLLKQFNKKYDIVIGNPPFGKIIKSKELLKKYKQNIYNNKTNNIFSFFVEKSLKIGKTVALVAPKSMISTPEFNKTRELLSKYNFHAIVDYGEKAFDGVKIETIGFILDTNENKNNNIKIESYINNEIKMLEQNYVFDSKLPVWVLYRNNFFDTVLRKMKLGIFNVFRDRTITKKHTESKGDVRVLKSRNIKDNQIINIENYDCYLSKDAINNFAVSKFLNRDNCILVPNLTYNPRACFLPKKTITDGSVAILTAQDDIKLKPQNLAYYATEEFRKFYMIAKNLGTRSLNIDSNSVYFFGITNI
ncbi:DNA cytosine methyltransferase [Candidatus Parcubacteria bacterium]|nr:DNA cytosine methyltransferase [Candidatus Parcubacteria bacterium]